MTSAHPNVSSLAVAVAISSFVTGTQALADRGLQTKSVDIQSNGHTEFTRSEVIVKPTLGDDQQPVFQSFTTTYPDQAPARASYIGASISFTDILSDIDSVVSTVDLFETGENNVAQKYTKVLKVADEGVFKFSHNLAEKKLVIEVRGGMTDQDSVKAVRDQLMGIESLEPLTEIAGPGQLFGVLKGANDRAGNLGTSDHYVALATIEVGAVEVNERTFMRLIASGDQPPDPGHLGQSIFVNDESLFAAATSAYIQVHVLGKNLQQKALNNLLAHSKPVGYIVHIEDDTQAYPVPAGYPKLEVVEDPGEIIVFRGQIPNPGDVAFVERLFTLDEEAVIDDSPFPVIAKVNKNKVKSYQYTLRSRQMALLEELAAQPNAEPDPHKLMKLADYEYLQQALSSAIPDRADEFQFSSANIKVAARIITPNWMEAQFVKHFSFKPKLRDFLTNGYFVQKLMPLLPSVMVGAFDRDETFATKIMDDMTRQLIEVENKLKELQKEEIRLIRFKYALQHELDRADASEHMKPEVQERYRKVEDKLAEILVKQKGQRDLQEKMMQEVERTALLEQQLRNSRKQAKKIHITQLAKELGIDDWDDTQPQEKQARRLLEKMNDMCKAVIVALTATGQPDEEAVKTKVPMIESQPGQQRTQRQSISTETEKIDKIKACFAITASHLNLKTFDGNADIKTQQKVLLQRVRALDAHRQTIMALNDRQHQPLQRLLTKNIQDGEMKVQDLQAKFVKSGLDEAEIRLMQATVATIYGTAPDPDSTPESRREFMETIQFNIRKLEVLEDELELIRTPVHSAGPEVLDKLSAVEKVLGMPSNEYDVYYRRQAIAEVMQSHITAAQRAEKEILELLKGSEKTLEIEVNKGDNKVTRLSKVHRTLLEDDIPENKLDEIGNNLFKPGSITLSADKQEKINLLSTHFRGHILNEFESPLRLQKRLLQAIETGLKIDKNENVAAKERSRDFIAKLAWNLKVELKKDTSLNEQKDALKEKIWALMDDLYEHNVDEAIKRDINNKIAHQLEIGDYQDDAPMEDQLSDIAAKLIGLAEQVNEAGHPNVNERIAAIDAELDRQLARLGPKPRYVLEREVARARQAVREAEDKSEAVYRKLDDVYHKKGPVSADVDPVTGEDMIAPDRVVKKIQTSLGLTLGDEQTTGDRIDDINTIVHGWDEVDEVDQTAGGELPQTRKKYADVTEFLRENDWKSVEVTNRRQEEWNAQKFLDRKKLEIEDIGNTDEKTKTKRKQEIARLGLILKRRSEALSKAKDALTDYHKTFLDVAEDAVGIEPAPSDTYKDRIKTLRNKRLELGGNDGKGGKIRQLVQEKARLEAELETIKADIGRMKEVLKAAEEAVENDGAPFQYTPGQAKIRADLHAYIQGESLRKQALEAAIGLAESAVKSGKTIPCLSTFDFDDEFAPIRLKVLAGNDLTLDQATRIVEVLKNLKATFTSESSENQTLNPLEEIQKLAFRAKIHIGTGTQEYDDEIHGMGAAAIHFVEHEQGDLKSFPEYFATHSASGNKIITLLREGQISQVELEHYMKAVRGVDGYQTVDEFEHFLGYKHGVKVPDFRQVVLMLPDEGIEEFVQDTFTPVTVATSAPAGMQESVAGMKEFAAAVIANYVLDDLAFENGRRTAAFLTNVQDTLTPYSHAAGIFESELIQTIHGILMQVHVAAVEQQLNENWVKPSASLIQAATWYFTHYKPLLVSHSAPEAAKLSLSSMAFLYLLDLTNRGDYTHRMLTPFQHWLERCSADLDRTGQYIYHSGIEKVSEVGGLAMPLGKAASSVILLKTNSLLFARQYNANPCRYRNLFRLVPEIVKSMGSGQGIQIPLLYRITPEKVKTLASVTAGLVLGPVATAGSYVHGLVYGFTYAQTFGLALASSLTFDFFMNDNRMLTQWLGGPLGRSLDKLNRWRSTGESEYGYVKRTAIATPQRFNETDEEYAGRIKTNNVMFGWTRSESYLQFRERRDRTMKMFDNGWEKYFKKSVPQWSFSHAESIPYSYTLGAFYGWQQSGNKKVHAHDKKNAP
ncbi:hypothetical protein [Endozoicomonas sp. ISHI1]|uniref:hypothetical protein n=2 Tax=unclassified Endozoicomonas TaxID=2644528 RepID=UPI002148B92A|nr:hypothetical protein [Endozoicomonas sp. ISHI1]